MEHYAGYELGAWSRISFEDYVTACKQFSRDTRDWHGLSDRNGYDALEHGAWEETCDHARGGLSITWAFRQTDQEIEAHAPAAYADELVDNLRNFDETLRETTLDYPHARPKMAQKED